MIDIYDSEAIIKIYRLLNKNCEAIDRFINNHALYFGTNSYEFGALDVCNNILDLMSRKNQLKNLKLIVDREEAITNFVPKEYWNLTANLVKQDKKFKAETN